MRSVATLVGVLLLAGCSRPTPKLDALKADPMATVAIPGARIVREFEHPEGEALGKPLIADFNRTFVVTEGESWDIVRAVRELAEENGWTTDYVDRDTYLGNKRLVVNGNRPWSLPAELTLAFGDRTSGILGMSQE